MRTAAAATIIVLLGNNIMLGRFPVWIGLLYVIGAAGTPVDGFATLRTILRDTEAHASSGTRTCRISRVKMNRL